MPAFGQYRSFGVFILASNSHPISAIIDEEGNVMREHLSLGESELVLEYAGVIMHLRAGFCGSS